MYNKNLFRINIEAFRDRRFVNNISTLENRYVKDYIIEQLKNNKIKTSERNNIINTQVGNKENKLSIELNYFYTQKNKSLLFGDQVAVGLGVLKHFSALKNIINININFIPKSIFINNFEKEKSKISIYRDFNINKKCKTIDFNYKIKKTNFIDNKFTNINKCFLIENYSKLNITNYDSIVIKIIDFEIDLISSIIKKAQKCA